MEKILRIPFTEIDAADLLVDAVYEGGTAKNLGSEVLSKVMHVGNSGGFRKCMKLGENGKKAKDVACNGVQREHNKKLNNGLPILHKVPPKRDYGRYFCIMAKKGGTSHGGLTEKLSPFFHAQKQEVNAYGR